MCGREVHRGVYLVVTIFVVKGCDDPRQLVLSILVVEALKSGSPKLVPLVSLLLHEDFCGTLGVLLIEDHVKLAIGSLLFPREKNAHVA